MFLLLLPLTPYSPYVWAPGLLPRLITNETQLPTPCAPRVSKNKLTPPLPPLTLFQVVASEDADDAAHVAVSVSVILTGISVVLSLMVIVVCVIYMIEIDNTTTGGMSEMSEEGGVPELLELPELPESLPKSPLAHFTPHVVAAVPIVAWVSSTGHC